MCLLSNRREPFVAKRDIVCYKLLCGNSWKGYYTPFQMVMVPSEYVSGERDFCSSGCVLADKTIYLKRLKKRNPSSLRKAMKKIHCWTIGPGFIHTYRNFEDVCKQVENNHHVGNYFAIFKCIIPKGTKYYFSGNIDDVQSFASSKIKFLEKIKTYG